MLRITTDETSHLLTLRLEGRLEGPWVAVLGQSWSGALPNLRGRQLCVDLNGLTFVDAEGKARLAEMHAQGAELLGEDLETKAIVAEIRTGRAGGGNGEAREARHLESVADLHEQVTDLQRLHAELHEVNQDLAHAARPLARLSQLSEEQRRQIARQLRAGLARWESVTQLIAQALGIQDANGQKTPERNKGESR